MRICAYHQEDGLLYVEVDPSGSDSWKLDPVVALLKEGAVGVIPTDTVYVYFTMSSCSFVLLIAELFGDKHSVLLRISILNF